MSSVEDAVLSRVLLVTFDPAHTHLTLLPRLAAQVAALDSLTTLPLQQHSSSHIQNTPLNFSFTLPTSLPPTAPTAPPKLKCALLQSILQERLATFNGQIGPALKYLIDCFKRALQVTSNGSHFL